MSSLKYLIKKEFIQFKRNRFISRLVFVFPVVIMLIVPLVTNMEVKGVRVAVVDSDGSQLSRRMRSHIEASKNLHLQSVGGDYNRAYRQLESGKVDVIVSIPEDCEQTVVQGKMPRIRVDANAVNATKSGIGSQYVVAAVGKALTEMTSEKGISAPGRDISVRYFYNETLDYRFYMIPAFIIILVMLICCFIPALNLVIEKEKGTIEQINVTPVSRLEFTLSKLIPYWIVGIVVLTEAILTAGLVYGLWPEGNAGVVYLAALVFALPMSGFAIAVANISDTMQQCIFVLFFFVMIFMLMSGLLTPLASMPQWAQWVTVAFPPRWFVEIMRSVYLKGTQFRELWPNFLALAVLSVLFCTLAAVTYRKQK